jgi:hypothetical protein
MITFATCCRHFWLTDNVDGDCRASNCADNESLSLLRKALEQVTSSGHLHLRNIANGGNELDDANPWGTAAVGEVIISTA